ncbi:HAD family hydrolase [uncultured Alistipes sp.]|uniref:HAD family hydrolase n=1 Tax=uncultured Alistipes sp. TaxID=538949 RepID=UPI0026168C2F|nr:HAD family hydrolase [uncultured Alistipes sp.]
MNRISDYRTVEVVAFDADDTLWVNEPFFRESERRFCALVAPWAGAGEAVERLYGREVANMPLYGYGVKACVLSMVETALELGGEALPAEVVRGIVALGRDQLQRPVELLPGVRETLRRLQGRYRLAVVTKGDLLDQRRKLRLSGLAPCFDAVEVMADKDEAAYGEVMRRLGVAPGAFLMVGNSLRSDVLPVVTLGGRAVHIPFGETWRHEEVDPAALAPYDFPVLERIDELTPLLGC